MNAFNGEKPRQTIGRLFQNITTERFQDYDSKINSTKDIEDYQWICDICDQASNSLIELKSHKIIDPDETTLDTFEKILKQDEVRRKKNQNNSGLFYQLTEMSKRSKSFAVMVGCYNEDVNKLKNQLISNDPKGYASFTEYRFLIVQPDSVYWDSVPQNTFWRALGLSWEMNAKHGESFLRHFLASFDPLSSYEITPKTGYERSLIDLLKQLKFGLTEDQIELAFDGKPYHVIDTQQLEIKLDKPTLTWIEKEKQAQESIEAEQNETTQEPVESIIDQITVFSKEELLMIRESIKKHDSLSNISKRLGKHRSHLQKIINAKESNNHGWKGLEWDVFRSWIIPILQEFDHTQVPLWICSNVEKDKIILSLQQSNNNYQKMKTANEKIKQELKVTQAKIKELEVTNKNSNDAWFDLREKCIKLGSENQDLKNQIDNQEKNEMNEATTLKLEAYQAEIKKLQAENEEYKETNEGLETESENLKTCIDELGLEVERLTDVLELEEEQKSKSKDTLHEYFEKLTNRAERVIDGLLDLIDEQKLTIDSLKKRKQC